MDEAEPLDNSSITCTTSVEVAEAVKRALAGGVPLIDYGQAHEGLGHRPPSRHTRVKRTGGVQEHHVEDMSVRVDAGCTVGELGRALVQADQFFPIDAEDEMTVGELIDHNVYGPLRLTYGGVRDLLLGVDYVDGQGQTIRVGGPTAHQFAGEDLTRLLVGSLGELGVITQATLRTFVMPAGTLSFDICLESPETLDNFLPYWLTTTAKPTWLTLSRESQRFVLHGAYFGQTTECMGRLRSLETLIENQPGLHIVGTGEDRVDRDRIRRLTRASWRQNAPAVVKMVVPPATTGFLCATLSETPVHDPKRMIEAYPAHGCVFVGGAFDPEDARRLDQQITHVTQPIGGFHLWHRRPGGVEDIPPFSPMPDDYQTLSQLKVEMDPHGILNPGRFLPIPTADVPHG